jgi:hypothetical protein
MSSPFNVCERRVLVPRYASADAAYDELERFYCALVWLRAECVAGLYNLNPKP